MHTIDLIWPSDARAHCWEVTCRKKARVRVKGLGCDNTSFCLPHYAKELRDYLGLRPPQPGKRRNK